MGNPVSPTTRMTSPLFTRELVEAQGSSDRDYLTTRVKLLLEAKEKYPDTSFVDIAQLANDPCGRGCCCCCNSLTLGADVINPGA